MVLIRRGVTLQVEVSVTDLEADIILTLLGTDLFDAYVKRFHANWSPAEMQTATANIREQCRTIVNARDDAVKSITNALRPKKEA